MTAYHGGKQLLGYDIACDIVNTVTRSTRKIKGYCEPFCGMLGVYQHIPKLFERRISFKAGDINKSVIQMWKALQNGWIPPSKCSKKEYDKLRYNSKSSKLKGYVIYCDPPYENSRYYDEDGSKRDFDHDYFWDWCRTMSKNNIVFISSYNTPKDFTVIRKYKTKNANKGLKTHGIEKLYMY